MMPGVLGTVQGHHVPLQVLEAGEASIAFHAHISIRFCAILLPSSPSMLLRMHWGRLFGRYCEAQIRSLLSVFNMCHFCAFKSKQLRMSVESSQLPSAAGSQRVVQNWLPGCTFLVPGLADSGFRVVALCSGIRRNCERESE